MCIRLCCNQTRRLFIEAAPVSTPYCFPSRLATSNQISRSGVYVRKKRVYEQYKRQDTEKVLQYYKYKYILNEYYANEGSKFKEEKRLKQVIIISELLRTYIIY